MTNEFIIKKISETTGKEELYLIESLSSKAGFFSTNGQLIFAELDIDNCENEGLDTQYLKLNMHVKIKTIKNNQTFKNGYYNLIIYKSVNDQNFDAFIKLCRIYVNNKENIQFKSFFYSLVSLFQLPIEQAYTNAVGFYGELKFLISAWEKYGIDLSDYWHNRGTTSRYDFSNNDKCIEVKTTSSNYDLVTIKHNQIFTGHDCWLATVNCEENDLGETIEDLINIIYSYANAFTGLAFSINIEKEIKKLSQRDIRERQFVTNEINLYDTEKINPFSIIPNNVTNLVYKLELGEGMKESDIRDVLKSFKGE